MWGFINSRILGYLSPTSCKSARTASPYAAWVLCLPLSQTKHLKFSGLELIKHTTSHNNNTILTNWKLFKQIIFVGSGSCSPEGHHQDNHRTPSKESGRQPKSSPEDHRRQPQSSPASSSGMSLQNCLRVTEWKLLGGSRSSRKTRGSLRLPVVTSGQLLGS